MLYRNFLIHRGQHFTSWTYSYTCSWQKIWAFWYNFAQVCSQVSKPQYSSTGIYPYLNYCIEVWGNTFPTYITPLNRLQNRAIRIILGCNKRAHLQPLYTSLKMLDISKIYMYNVQMFRFKRYHCLLPDIFNSFFCKNVDITGRETRQSENLRIPEGVIGIRRRTIRFSGVSLNNYFHNKISYKYSINSYKFQLKEYLLSGSSLPLIPK